MADYVPADLSYVRAFGCLDCGALVGDTKGHDRFHDILNDHGGMLAVLRTSHLSESSHEARYGKQPPTGALVSPPQSEEANRG